MAPRSEESDLRELLLRCATVLDLDDLVARVNAENGPRSKTRQYTRTLQYEALQQRPIVGERMHQMGKL